jgi:hypothetical protein
VLCGLLFLLTRHVVDLAVLAVIGVLWSWESIWQGWLVSRSAYRLFPRFGHADNHYITTHCLSQCSRSSSYWLLCGVCV